MKTRPRKKFNGAGNGSHNLEPLYDDYDAMRCQAHPYKPQLKMGFIIFFWLRRTNFIARVEITLKIVKVVTSATQTECKYAHG
jgi:hypothetical protein